jgi:hypothetical protein
LDLTSKLFDFKSGYSGKKIGAFKSIFKHRIQVTFYLYYYHSIFPKNPLQQSEETKHSHYPYKGSSDTGRHNAIAMFHMGGDGSAQVGCE